MQPGAPCPACTATAARPDVVWFGELPYFLDEIYGHLAEAEIFAAIGTSGQVYPAAAFVHEAQAAGAHTVELNLEPSEMARSFAEHRAGPASESVSAWVEGLLSAA